MGGFSDEAPSLEERCCKAPAKGVLSGQPETLAAVLWILAISSSPRKNLVQMQEESMERRFGSVPMIGHVVSWAKRLSHRFSQSDELRKLDPEEINRIARDFGVSVSELLVVAKSDVGVQALLKQRLVEIGLSEELLQNRYPKQFGDLNRVCASCS